MCGIVGILESDQTVRIQELNRFADTLMHRGPNDRGIFVDRNLGLGHRRLSILDLSELGRNPMPYGGCNGKRFWISFNGEIYNFLELRSELEGLGHRFRSETDTEVILASYAQWGEESQRRFNGMWAFAIWDSKERELFLSRDRFGVKPLHIYYDGRRFAFASEMKAFLALDGFTASFRVEVVNRALSDYTRIEGSEECLLNDVRRLRAGYCMRIRAGEEPRPRRWWRTIEHLPVIPSDEESQAESFRELFLDACKIRMRSDVPLGTALSGGLDSSAVLCGMAHSRQSGNGQQRLASSWQRAFVGVFPNTIQDERHYAELVIKHTNTTGEFIRMEPAALLANLEAIIFQFEEIYDFPGSPWLLYRFMRQNGVVISIDGHGGDELLGGYHWHPEFAFLDAISPELSFDRVLDCRATLSRMLDCGAEGIESARINSMDVGRWRQNLRQVFPTKAVPDVLNPGVCSLPPEHATYPFQDYLFDQAELKSFDHLNRKLYYDFHYSTLPTILRNFDRCSMAHGVEIRAPFMDWRLVCFAFALPGTQKISNGWTKYILRRSLRGVLPERVRQRTGKLGFVSPLSDWLAGPLGQYVLDISSSADFLSCQFWDGPEIRRRIEVAFRNKDMTAARSLWPYIQASCLIRLFSKAPRYSR